VALAFAAVLLTAADAASDSLKIERADPPKSFRFSRGSDPVEIAITVRYEVESGDGGEIAFAVHDQRDRPLMTRPMPIAQVKQGRDSIIFKTVVQSLGSDVTRVTVETVLLSAIRGTRRARPGETWRADVAVPPWPRFLRGFLRYRESLDRELPNAAVADVEHE
jgi:hypothetical protein